MTHAATQTEVEKASASASLRPHNALSVPMQAMAERINKLVEALEGISDYMKTSQDTWKHDAVSMKDIADEALADYRGIRDDYDTERRDMMRSHWGGEAKDV